MVDALATMKHDGVSALGIRMSMAKLEVMWASMYVMDGTRKMDLDVLH